MKFLLEELWHLAEILCIAVQNTWLSILSQEVCSCVKILFLFMDKKEIRISHPGDPQLKKKSTSILFICCVVIIKIVLIVLTSIID